jgi:acetyl-CoA synthetase
MRRLLRELATHGEIKGDTTTLEDFTVIAKLREAEEGAKYWRLAVEPSGSS